jgi:hypothetical protein
MPDESASHPDIRGVTRTREEGGSDDAAIAQVARRQHGVVGRQQLLELGLRRRAIEHRLAIGRLHLLHPGVYAVGYPLVPREGRWMAAVLACGPEAVLSHWSAAAFWGIRPNSRTRIDVTVPHRSRSSAPIRRHISHVPIDEQTTEEGIPVTSVPRTIFDLAATEPVNVVENMLREAEYRQLYDRLFAAAVGRALSGAARGAQGEGCPGAAAEVAAGPSSQPAGGTVRPVPAPASPTPSSLQRLDRPRRQALPGRLPLARQRPDRRA